MTELGYQLESVPSGGILLYYHREFHRQSFRMSKAGADIVGANCLFDPWINLETVKKMKIALDAFNQKPYLMSQPNAYRCPDCGPFGWLSLPEFPYGNDGNYIDNI